MAETLLDIKSFAGLNFSPHLQSGECQDCCNLDDENAPALRTARDFSALPLSGGGTFQGAWIEDGEILATVWDDQLHVGEKAFPLKPLGVSRRFLRILQNRILIQPDMYLYEPEHQRCYPHDNSHTASGDVVGSGNTLTVTLYSPPTVGYGGKVYLDGLDFTYYDEETAPTSVLLYFSVTSAETLLGDRYRLVLTPVYRNEFSYTYNLNLERVTLTVRQVVPPLTHAVLCRGRLWGVAGKKLVASKLGNPLVFDDFAGLVTDSFELPMEEKLVAVSHFGERVVVWSKTALYELYGDRPTNYQISVAKVGGCAYPFSVCNAGGYLIYADAARIYRYGGGDPQVISDRPEFPAWSDLFGVSDGETCLLGACIGHWRLFRYRPSRNTFFEVPLAATGGVVADGERYLHDGARLYQGVRSRSESDYRYRSGWLNLDRLGGRAPREICVHLDGAPPRVALITRDGVRREITAVDDRGDGLYRLPFPADLCNRVFAVELRGRGEACLHRITVRG